MVGLFVLLPSLVAGVLVHGAHVYRDMLLTAETIAPDGFERSAELVNGQFPGPLLTANKGDSVTIHVTNRLLDPTMRRSTSIHWHGIFQHRNNYNDGASFVTQCPIAPHHSYPYRLALGDQAGTFWYHSHLSTQYIDGIRGPLVIYDPDDPQQSLYDVDDDTTVITLADWYHPTAVNATDSFFAGGYEPVPDSGLVNGIGRYNGGPEVPWARINVVAGTRYRFRIISLSAVGVFDFSISNHSMTVIEADGVAHLPYEVHSIRLLAGQRYSVIVTANQSVDNYWIRATQTFRGYTTNPHNPNFNGANNWAVLHYSGAPDSDPSVPQPTGLQAGDIQFQEYKLVPLADPAPPGGSQPPDQVFTFEFTFANPNGDKWTINGVQYKSPSVPTLLNILANGIRDESDFGKNENTFVLKSNAIIEIVFVGAPGHPFHLHGHSFSVIQSASGGGPNYINPPRRDVVASGNSPTNGQPTRIRFITDNSGAWFLHCHIEWHLAGGLAAVFAEDPAGIEEGPMSVQPNERWERLCEIYNNLPHELQ